VVSAPGIAVHKQIESRHASCGLSEGSEDACTKAAEGTLRATMYSIDQGPIPITVSSIKLDGANLSLSVDALRGKLPRTLRYRCIRYSARCSPSEPAFTLDCTDRARFSTMVKSRSRYWSIRSYHGFVLALLPGLVA
jgi:hypothetical protein